MHIQVIQLQYKNILISFGLSFVNWFLLCKLYNLYIYIYTMFLTRVPSWFVMIIILGRLLLYYEINIFLRYVVKYLNLKINRYLILWGTVAATTISQIFAKIWTLLLILYSSSLLISFDLWEVGWLVDFFSRCFGG